MDRLQTILQIVMILVCVPALAASSPTRLKDNGTSTEVVTILPEETEQLLANPGIGWETFHRTRDKDRSLPIGTTLTFTMKWQNIGSAPCYKPYRVAYRLSDERGQARTLLGSLTVNQWMPGSVDVFTDEFLKQPPDLPPGEIVAVTDPVTVPEDMKPGAYRLAVAIVGEDSMEPTVRLAIEGRASDGWYPLSELKISE